MFGVVGIVTIVVYEGVRILGGKNSEAFHSFTYFVVGILVATLGVQMGLRYGHDFRYQRSPRRRKNMRTAIDELKKIRDTW
jgi:hypothetical protein